MRMEPRPTPSLLCERVHSSWTAEVWQRVRATTELEAGCAENTVNHAREGENEGKFEAQPQQQEGNQRQKQQKQGLQLQTQQQHNVLNNGSEREDVPETQSHILEGFIRIIDCRNFDSDTRRNYKAKSQNSGDHEHFPQFERFLEFHKQTSQEACFLSVLFVSPVSLQSLEILCDARNIEVYTANHIPHGERRTTEDFRYWMTLRGTKANAHFSGGSVYSSNAPASSSSGSNSDTPTDSRRAYSYSYTIGDPGCGDGQDTGPTQRALPTISAIRIKFLSLPGEKKKLTAFIIDFSVEAGYGAPPSGQAVPSSSASSVFVSSSPSSASSSFLAALPPSTLLSPSFASQIFPSSSSQTATPPAQEHLQASGFLPAFLMQNPSQMRSLMSQFVQAMQNERRGGQKEQEQKAWQQLQQQQQEKQHILQENQQPQQQQGALKIPECERAEPQSRSTSRHPRNHPCDWERDTSISNKGTAETVYKSQNFPSEHTKYGKSIETGEETPFNRDSLTRLAEALQALTNDFQTFRADMEQRVRRMETSVDNLAEDMKSLRKHVTNGSLEPEKEV